VIGLFLHALSENVTGHVDATFWFHTPADCAGNYWNMYHITNKEALKRSSRKYLYTPQGRLIKFQGGGGF